MKKPLGLQINFTPADARKMFFWLIAIDALLVLVYGVIHILKPGMPWGPARELFDLDQEMSIPAWFSAIQLFVIGGMLFLASRNNQRKQQVPSWLLTAGSLCFIFLSADEGAAIHERISPIAKKLELSWLLFKGNHGAWISLYLIVAITIVLVSAPHLRRLWVYFRRETRIALSGAIVFVLGGVGFEIISYLVFRSGSMKRLYKLEVACEEFLEMSGASIMLYAVFLLSFKIATASPLSESEGITEPVKTSGCGILVENYSICPMKNFQRTCEPGRGEV